MDEDRSTNGHNPSQEYDFQPHMLWCFFVCIQCRESRSGAIILFNDIGKIVDQSLFNLSFQ
jgi:hypothetical protein